MNSVIKLLSKPRAARSLSAWFANSGRHFCEYCALVSGRFSTAKLSVAYPQHIVTSVQHLLLKRRNYKLTEKESEYFSSTFEEFSVYGCCLLCTLFT